MTEKQIWDELFTMWDNCEIADSSFNKALRSFVEAKKIVLEYVGNFAI